MSSIVTGILSSTLGLLLNKARDATAKSLQDGDVTDAKIREMVVRELNDIKTKLDGLSRKDLLSSYMFLKEGVQLVNDSLDKSIDEGKNDGGVTSSTLPSASDILNDALQLSEAMKKLKIVSDQSEFARKRFKRAREEATHAFCNEALSIRDRIFAAKLRVVSEILECLDSPDTAVTSCLLFLEQLHDLSAVRVIFSVYLGRGVKSILGKTERAENVKSIMMINYVLYHFVSKFSSKNHSTLAWPTIQLPDRAFNPILSWREVSGRKSWDLNVIQPPNEVRVHEEILKYSFAMNGRGEIIVANHEAIKFISTTGESRLAFPLFLLRIKDDTWAYEVDDDRNIVLGLAVEDESIVYIVMNYKSSESDDGGHPMLYVLNEHCSDVKFKTELTFLPKDTYFGVSLTVKKNKDIVMRGRDNVYVFDNTGQLKYEFETKCPPYFIDVTPNNGTIVAPYFSNSVEIYTEKGHLWTTIDLPATHNILGMAFHFGINKIIYTTSESEKNYFFLHSYSEKGEQYSSICLGSVSDYNEFRHYRITSHPSGPAAILTREGIVYL